MPLATLLFALTVAQAPAPSISLDAPQVIVTIDTGKMKGEPWRLAWSPDLAQLYVETADRDISGNPKSTKGAIITLANKSMKNVGQPPDWAVKYWTWKSAQASPAAPAFKIDVKQEQRTVRAVAAPTGGALARGGTADPTSGTSLGDVASAADTAQVENVFTLRIKGDALGEWINAAVVPGANFSWAPAPRHMIVYAKNGGGPLMTLDDQGHKAELSGAKNAVLPAWSDDGTKIAWMEKKDKKHYDVTIAAVK